ncbi:MAG: hypothetical protein ACRDQZ_25825 [Mycobacteriales bacterium]
MSYWDLDEHRQACREMNRLAAEGKRDSKEYEAANQRAIEIEKKYGKERNGDR